MNTESVDTGVNGSWQDVAAASAEAQAAETRITTRLVKRTIKVKLTQTQLADRAMTMSHLIVGVVGKKAQRKDLNSDISADEKEITKLGTECEAGEGEVEMEVLERTAFDTNTIDYLHPQTGEVLETRAMDAEDRQAELPFDDSDEDDAEDDGRVVDGDGNDGFGDDADLITEPEAILANAVEDEAPQKPKRGRKKAAS